jgi:hypothetical protein
MEAPAEFPHPLHIHTQVAGHLPCRAQHSGLGTTISSKPPRNTPVVPSAPRTPTLTHCWIPGALLAGFENHPQKHPGSELILLLGLAPGSLCPSANTCSMRGAMPHPSFRRGPWAAENSSRAFLFPFPPTWQNWVDGPTGAPDLWSPLAKRDPCSSSSARAAPAAFCRQATLTSLQP